MAAVDLYLPVAFVRQAARARHRDDAVMRRPQREGRHFGARRGVEVDRGIVDRMARDQVIEAPRAIGAPAARKGRAQRDDARDLARMMPGIFAGIEAAQAPPYHRRPANALVTAPLDADEIGWETWRDNG